MATISDAQIAAAARGAGISGNNVAIAVAIALAESGGNPRAHNKTPPDNSYGLWQINMLGNLGPARRKQFGLTSNEQLFDPATNAKAMAAISNGGKNWRPWTTYTRGTYLRFMQRGNAVSSGTSDTPVQSTPVGVASNVSDFAGYLSDPAVWRKVGLYLLGFILIILGIVLIVGLKANSLKGQAISAAVKVVGN